MFTELMAAAAGGGSVLAVLAWERSVVAARAWAARFPLLDFHLSVAVIQNQCL